MAHPDFPSPGSRRVLLLPLTVRDGEITRRILREHQIETCVCRSVPHLCEELQDGAGLLLVAEEHLLKPGSQRLMQDLMAQPPWSDLPLLVLTAPHQTKPAELEAWQRVANVTLLPRPLSIQSFVGVVLSRLRDRGRQYAMLNLVRSLEQSSREFRQLADAMPQMVFTADAHGKFQYFNRRAIEFFHLNPDDIASFDWKWVVHKDDIAEVFTAWTEAIRGGSSFQGEFRVRTSNQGDHRWHLTRALPVQDSQGQVIRWFGTATDIHEHKTIQHQLQRSRWEAAAASHVKSEFLANMSHEIRTPMTAILGYAELLADKEDDPEKREFLEIIERNGSFLLEIINDILDLSKIEAGKLEIHAEPFDLVPLVEDIRSLMQLRANENRIDFRVEYVQPMPRQIHSDPKRLRQILLNLVGNAIKFTSQGGVALRISCHEEQVVFEVVDTGIGMSPQQVEQLFQAFRQADGSVSRQYGGSGLGLAISQRLAKMLGGEITVESQLHQGSTFTCAIHSGTIDGGAIDGTPQREIARHETTPTDAGHSTATRDHSPPCPPKNKRNGQGPGRASRADSAPATLTCCVLVVDDRRDVRFLAGRILTKAGAEVRYAEDGVEAVQLVQQWLAEQSPPDIVLMDMQMPILDGYQATQRLRELGFQQPIIALTADAMHGDMDRCLSSGCNAYISKPIDSRELIDIVAEHVS